MEESVIDLVNRAIKKDTVAQSKLYMLTKDKAYYLALRLLRNTQDAEDVLQEAYITAFSKLEMLDNANKFQGWLDTIVINRAKDLIKKKKPIVFADMKSADDEEYIPDIIEERIEYQPQENLDYEETKYLVQNIIDELSDEQRIAVMLYYYKEMSVSEIATYSECSTGTIKSRLNYARKNIKLKVEELERSGTKLYCMPLLPFLSWMFHTEAKKMVFTSEIVQQGIQAAFASNTVSGEMLMESAKEVTKAVADNGIHSATTAVASATKTTGMAIGVKAGIAAVAITLGVTGGIIAYNVSNSEESNKKHMEWSTTNIEDNLLEDVLSGTKITATDNDNDNDNDTEQMESDSFLVGSYRTSVEGLDQLLEIYAVTDNEIIFSINCSNFQGNIGMIEKTSAPITDENVAIYAADDLGIDFQLKLEYTKAGTIELTEIYGEDVYVNPYCGLNVYMSGTYEIEGETADVGATVEDENYANLMDYGSKGNLWINHITSIAEEEEYYVITADVSKPEYVTEDIYQKIQEGAWEYITISETYYDIQRMTQDDQMFYAGEYKLVTKDETYYIDNTLKQAEGMVEDYFDASMGAQYISPEGCYYITDAYRHPLYTLLESQITLKLSKDADIQLFAMYGGGYGSNRVSEYLNSSVLGQTGLTFEENSGQIVFDSTGAIIRFYEDYYQ